MKKTILLLLTLAAVLLLSTIAVSAFSRGDVQLQKIDIYEEELHFLTMVNVENDAGKRLKDTRITVTIPEWGTRVSSGRFDLPSNREETRQLLMDVNEVDSHEEVWVRIVVSNDEGRRVKHRPLFLI